MKEHRVTVQYVCSAFVCMSLRVGPFVAQQNRNPAILVCCVVCEIVPLQETAQKPVGRVSIVLLYVLVSVDIPLRGGSSCLSIQIVLFESHTVIG